MTPSIGYITSALERIRQSVTDLEREMLGHYMTGPGAEEFKELAERMVRLTQPNKGHLPEGTVAREFKDAA
jgi:HAMP domain-containing protein